MSGFSVFAEFAAKLDDGLVEGAGGAVIVVAPDLVEETVAGEGFLGMGVEEFEEF